MAAAVAVRRPPPLPPHEPRLPSDVDILAWLLEDPHQQSPEHRAPRARLAQEEALHRLLADLDGEQLLGLLHDHRSSLRRHAARALGRRTESGTLPQVAKRLEGLACADPCPEVCKEAVVALGSLTRAAGSQWRREAGAIGSLQRLRRYDHVQATRSACDKELVELFRHLPLHEHLGFLKEGSEAERVYAVQTLADKFAQNPARWRWQVLHHLEQALRKDDSWSVKECAAQSMRTIAMLDPAGAGSAAVLALERFLHEDQIHIMVQVLKKDAAEAEWGRRVQDTCKEALYTCAMSLAFFGWKLLVRGREAREPGGGLLPSIQWTVRAP